MPPADRGVEGSDLRVECALDFCRENLANQKGGCNTLSPIRSLVVSGAVCDVCGVAALSTGNCKLAIRR